MLLQAVLGKGRGQHLVACKVIKCISSDPEQTRSAEMDLYKEVRVSSLLEPVVKRWVNGRSAAVGQRYA